MEIRPAAPILSLSCMHCAQPACAEACPVGAISKRADDGIVTVDRDACQGKDNCDMCKQACPYDIPQYGTEENAKMQMCNFCIERLTAGRRPSCVVACPARALDYGPMDVLVAKHGSTQNAEGFTYSNKTKPSIVIKPWGA